MKIPKENFYFDTSSINKLVDITNHDPIETSKLWAKKRRVCCISPVNFYEIFQNTSIERREDILYTLGMLCKNQSILFDNPTRIIFSEVLGYKSNSSTSFEDSVKESWADVKNNPEKITIILDPDSFKDRRLIFKIFEKSIRFILKHDIMELSEEEFQQRTHADSNLVGAFIIRMIATRFDKETFGKEIQIKSFLIYLFFCFGVEPESSFLETYWEKRENFEKGNETLRTLNRMMEILRNYDEDLLFNNNYIKIMTDYILFENNETNKKVSASTLSDAMHLIYSSTCKYFITDDSSILEFSKKHQLVQKNHFFSVEDDFILVSEKHLDEVTKTYLI